MNRFDKILWRINGVVFLLMLLGGSILVVIALCESFIHSTNQNKDAAVINVNQGTHEKEYLHLGGADLFNGTSTVRMSLYADSNYRGSWSSSSGGRIRNYLFLDSSKMTSRWLFQGFTNLIVECHDLRSPFKSVEKNVVGSVYEIIDSDSNHDGKIDTDDQPAAFFASSNGQQITQIVPPSERIVSVEQLSAAEFLIVYTMQKSTMGAVFSVETGKKLREAKIVLDEK
jgi:hypothetical protein